MTTYMIRIVILGDSFSGKTSLFNMLLYGIAYESFCTTISPSFGKYLDNYILYDTPGQLRWLNFAKPYIEVADAAIIMYHESEESVNKWKKNLFMDFVRTMAKTEFYLIFAKKRQQILWGQSMLFEL